jgi:VanZ family protein
LNLFSKQRLAAWVPVLLWLILIFVLSSVPEVPHQSGLPHARDRRFDDTLRNGAHLAEYGILTILIWRAVRRYPRPAAVWVVTAVAPLLYAASDELHQILVPGRTCSLEDWLFDAGGMLVGLALLIAWRRLARRAAPSAAHLEN